MVIWHETWDITEEQSAALNMVLRKYQNFPDVFADNDVTGVIADVLIALDHPEIWLQDQ